MNEVVVEFLSFVSSEKGLSPNTKSAYEKDLEQFQVFCKLQQLAFRHATLSDLRKFLAYLRRLELSERSIARKSSTLKQFYKFLLREGKIESDPSQLLTVIVKQKRLPKHLTEGEVDALLKAADGVSEVAIRDRAILEFWYATGCRVTELVTLRVENFDWQEGTVKVVGKGSRERIVPLTRAALASALRYKDLRHEQLLRFKLKETDVFFLSGRGQGFTRQGVWKLLKRYAKKAGITRKIWPHMIRHSVATHVLRGGADLRVVQELLGHRSITTTEVYTHLDIENLKTMQNKFHPRN